MSERTTGRVIERGGRHLHLHTTSYGDDGPRIAFCHGLFGQGRNWTQIAKALASRTQVTLLDLPDHGRSPWTERFSYADMADTVAAELAALAPGERWVLVGHSMGGKAAMLLALRHPEVLAGLVVVDISPIAHADMDGFTTYVEAMRGLPLDELTNRLAADEAMREAVPEESVRAFLLQNLRREGQSWHWQMNLGLLGDSLETIGGWPTEDIPAGAAYEGPTLWIAGSESGYVSEAANEPMRALFPHVRLVRIKNASHWVHSDQPETFLATVQRFVDRTGPTRG